MTADPFPSTPWTLARRAARMNPSILREILKVTDRPGILSLAGGLPSPDSFPVEAMRAASERVLRDTPREALQYAASEGFGPLREWVAAHLRDQGLTVDADQVLITTGSQQGLDLVAKVLVDSGAPVAVETPTYLGALQAFAPMEPLFASVASDADGPRPDAVAALPHDAPPPRPRAARWPEGVIYLGSFSKVLAPGLRLGYVVAPRALFPKLLQAKQAADLHTPGFNQRVVFEVIRDGFLDRHVPTIRARYRVQRDALCAALAEHLPPGSEWQAPSGGMFCWVRLPAGCDAVALLPRAVDAGVAFVPGAAFYAHQPDARTVRLSFVTLTPDEIRTAVATLGAVLRRHLTEEQPEPTP